MHSQILAAINAAPLSQLEDLSKLIWKAWGEKLVTDEESDSLLTAIKVRQSYKPPRKKSIFPPKRVVVRTTNEQKLVRLTRRRQLAFGGYMPPTLAVSFTPGQLAVLSVIAQLCIAGEGGTISRTASELSARAGVGLTTARDAIRQAKKLGLIAVKERRVMWNKNLPNVITIVDKSWLLWIDHRRKVSKHRNPRVNKDYIRNGIEGLTRNRVIGSLSIEAVSSRFASSSHQNRTGRTALGVKT